MSTNDLWLDIISQILSGLQSFTNWRSYESLGWREGCLFVEFLFPDPNESHGYSAQLHPVWGSNQNLYFCPQWHFGFMSKYPGMPLSKCPQEALSLGIRPQRSFLVLEQGRWCYLLHPAWVKTPATNWLSDHVIIHVALQLYCLCFLLICPPTPFHKSTTSTISSVIVQSGIIILRACSAF